MSFLIKDIPTRIPIWKIEFMENCIHIFYISFIYSSKLYLFDYVEKQFGWEKKNTFNNNNNNRELFA